MTNEINDLLNDFDSEVSENQDEALELLNVYAAKQVALEDEIEEKEKELKQLKKNLAVYSEKKIPDILIKHNLVGSTLKHGTYPIKVEEVIKGSVKVDNRPKAWAWLKEHGFGDIIDIKLELKFKPDEQEQAHMAEGLLQGSGFDYKSTEGVHASRLNSFVKTKVLQEKEDGVEEFPKELFGVYEGFKTKIER